MSYRISGFGWLPDALDHRDHFVRDSAVRNRVERVMPALAPKPAKVPSASAAGVLRADLREWCSPIESQGSIGSCTAQAVVGALEYFQRRTRGIHVDASKLFLYRVTRRYLGWELRGDTGAFVRSTIKALRIFGTLPESYWPYVESTFDTEPEAFHYAFAQSFRGLEYFRLEEEPAHLKSALDSGLPFAFGFTCFSSLESAEVGRTGLIPYPLSHDRVIGGHAVLAVGYTDTHVLIRNSWGTEWGDGGYGYLPWEYFDAGSPLATDCWALVNATWLDGDAGAEGQVPFASKTSGSATHGLTAAAAPAAVVTRAASLGRTDFLVKVRDGNDPARQVPLRLSSSGVEAVDPIMPVPLAVSDKRAALYLRSIVLKESFDWALLGDATNEVYVTAICWDLSGRPPVVFPAANVEALKGAYRTTPGERVAFVGDGVQLWPLANVVGGLNVRILIFENDDDVRNVGQRLTAIKALVDQSQLTTVLASLAVAPTAAAITAIATTATELVGIVGALLANDGDDLVALFDGSYGAERVNLARTERYDQRGCAVELELAGDP